MRGTTALRVPMGRGGGVAWHAMKVVIIGGGEVGRSIAEALAADRHDVIIVDSNAERVARLESQLDARVVQGNGASPAVLHEAGADNADLLLAVTQVDEVNLIAALAAHQLGVTRTVARVRDSDYFGTNEAFAQDVLGIDFVIHPERATADEIAAAILLPGSVHVYDFAAGQVAVAEVVLGPRSPLVGLAPSGLTPAAGHFIAGVIRSGQAYPLGDIDEFRLNDHALVGAARHQLPASVARIAGTVTKARDTMIFGAGKVGLYLAQRLEEHGVRPTVLERDAARARFVAERLPGSSVIHEDGVGQQTLLAHGVETVGAFVACTGDDRANLVATMFAKQLGAGLCLPVVSREEFTPLAQALGVDTAFSPRQITAAAIIRFIRGEHVLTVQALPGGAELMELTVGDHWDALGAPVEDCGLPAGCAIVAILRDKGIRVPKPGARVLRGDSVVVMATRPAVPGAARTFRTSG